MGSAGGAQLLFEGVAVLGESVQGSKSNEGVPNVSAPEPGRVEVEIILGTMGHMWRNSE
jgi:hypothetical protein